jgi:hypothetical protein
MLTIKDDSIFPSGLLITGLNPGALYWSSTEATKDNVEFHEAIAMTPGVGVTPGTAFFYDRRVVNRVRAIRAF